MPEARTNEFHMSAADRFPQGACDFFWVFARFEFALKENGFAKQNGTLVKIQWKKFANELGCEFFDKIKNDAVAPTLLAVPPQQQFIDDANNLQWRVVPRPSDVEGLIFAVTRVRNNLFHGGKCADTDKSRSEKLIAEAQDVIKEALRAHKNVRLSFNNS